jgi:hypothetical protein
MDYRGLYQDLLAMADRAVFQAKTLGVLDGRSDECWDFAYACADFATDIYLRELRGEWK